MDPKIVKKTQDTLGKIIKKPPLTEKLLSKPPFRFLHDVVTSVIKTTGFMQGLYTEAELNSENVKDKDSKIAFLQKAVDFVCAATGKSLSAKPAKIVAGHEPEKTNELLQGLAEAINNNGDNDEYVKKVLKGGGGGSSREERKEKDRTKSADRRKSSRDSEDKKDGDRERSRDKGDRERRHDKDRDDRDRKHRDRDDKDRDRDKDRKDRHKDRDRDRDHDRDSKRDKSRDGREERHRDKDRERSRKVSDSAEQAMGDVPPHTKTRTFYNSQGHKASHPQNNKNHNDKAGGTKTSGPSHRQIKSNREAPPPHASNSDQTDVVESSELTRVKRRRTPKGDMRSPPEAKCGGEAAGVEGVMREDEKRREMYANPQGDGGGVLTSGQSPRISHDDKPHCSAKRRDQSGEKENESPARVNGEREDKQDPPSRLQRPASAKGSRRRREGENEAMSEEGEDEEFQKPVSHEPVIGEDDLPPQVQAARQLARPSSARPAPPRPKQEASESEPAMRLGTGQPANLIVDDNDDDDEDLNFLVEESAPPPPEPDMTLSKPAEEDEAAEHGALVKKMLESKKELEGGSINQQSAPAKKTEIERPVMSDAQRRKQRELVQKEVEKLRTSIQGLTRSANPLGKVMDYVQEDLDSMQQELDKWRAENAQHALDLKREMSVTDRAIEPLRQQLAELERGIGDQLDQIAATKANIIRNDQKLSKMLRSIAGS